MQDTQELKTISLRGSSITWEDVDARVKQLGLDRSKYTQMLYEKDIKNRKLKDRILEIILFFIFILQLFILILVIR